MCIIKNINKQTNETKQKHFRSKGLKIVHGKDICKDTTFLNKSCRDL